MTLCVFCVVSILPTLWVCDQWGVMMFMLSPELLCNEHECSHREASHHADLVVWLDAFFGKSRRLCGFPHLNMCIVKLEHTRQRLKSLAIPQLYKLNGEQRVNFGIFSTVKWGKHHDFFFLCNWPLLRFGFKISIFPLDFLWRYDCSAGNWTARALSFLSHWNSIVAGCREERRESWKRKKSKNFPPSTFLIPFSINFVQKNLSLVFIEAKWKEVIFVVLIYSSKREKNCRKKLCNFTIRYAPLRRIAFRRFQESAIMQSNRWNF